MLSKEDYKDYLGQIYAIEQKMHNLYAACVDKVEDNYIKKTFSDLSRDETSHELIVRDLMKLVNI